MNISNFGFLVLLSYAGFSVASGGQGVDAALAGQVASEVSSEVVVDGPSGNKLAGTFLLREGASPAHRVPAVVFITGSGLQDRDETIFGHKPFRAIATTLAQAGIASIRCDDRGFGKSTGDGKLATTFDFLEDAKAQVAWLRSRPEIDPKQIGVVGHSEGGLIGLLMSQAPDTAVNFAVLLAPPGISGGEILVGQSADMFTKMKVEPIQLAFTLEKHRQLIDAVVANADEATLTLAMRALVDAQLDCLAKPKPPEATIESTVKQGLAQVSSPWMRTFIELDPAPAIRHIGVPMLILFGERDVQVSPARNFTPYQTGTLESPVKPEIVIIPKVNHLFQPARTGMPDEYATIRVEIDPEVLKKIADWVVSTTHSQPSSQPSSQPNSQPTGPTSAPPSVPAASPKSSP